jgi:hypothetical protein
VKLTSDVPVPNGFSMVSSVIPQSAGLDVLGFPVNENDTVYRFDNTLFGGKGGFKSYNFSADNPPPGWTPSIPTPNVGESFFVASDPLFGGARTWHRSFVVGPP